LSIKDTDLTKKTEQPKHTLAGLIARAILPLFLLCSGCGLVGMAGTLTDDENKIPAEFDLTKSKDSKILVLVDQPAYLSAEVNLRQYLTDAINASFESKLKFKAERLFTYEQLSDFRAGRSDFRELSPSRVGAALDANMVLFVVVANYEILKLSGTDYYRGMLSARALLLDCSNGNRLWPAETESRIIKVGFEVERGGREVAAARLAGDAAYCITRYFYNCPKRSFKIADDLTRTGWTDWK
jgi:hypothetical protein